MSQSTGVQVIARPLSFMNQLASVRILKKHIMVYFSEGNIFIIDKNRIPGGEKIKRSIMSADWCSVTFPEIDKTCSSTEIRELANRIDLSDPYTIPEGFQIPTE